MFKKLLTISMLLIFISTLFYAQSAERLILRSNGDQIKLNSKVDLKEALKESKFKNIHGKELKSTFAVPNFEVNGTLDTLGGGLTGTNFGFFGQDVFMQYFVAPADLTIKAAAFDCSDDAGAASGVTLRLMKLNWDYATLVGVPADLHMGRYPAEGDGFNNIDAFGEKGATGVWEDLTDGVYPLPPWTDNADPALNTFDYDLWSDAGTGFPFVPVNDGELQWVEMNLIGEPELLQGDVFAVVLEHQGTNLDADRIGVTAEVVGVPAWKYYENPRSSAGTEGWHARTYSWEFVVAVELTGDRAPNINSYDQLATSLETGPRTVTANITDDNPSGGNAGVASATLSYSLDDGTTWTDMAMTGTEPDFSAEIPGQVPGTSVWYKINAVDVEGLAALETPWHNYRVFEQVNTQALLVFNGFTEDSGYPQDYYFAVDWTHDVWAFGALTDELIAPYKNIIEIATNGPTAANDSVVAKWLAADGTRNYMLAGDEWLGGAAYGWPGTPVTTAEGDFARDILGIDVYYGDLVSSSADVTPVMAVEGSDLGGALYDAYTQRNADSSFTSSILYDPNYEIGVSNWLDGVAFLEDVLVDMMAVDTVYAAETGGTVAIAGHRVLPAGNKIVFFGYDPLSLNQGDPTIAAGDDPEYNWWSYTLAAPQYEVLDWFGGLVDVKQINDAIPAKYTLNQNYPNPFNPTTKIEFSIPKTGLTSLKVYNILGQEVAQLLNKSLTAGSYSVDFDASQLSSGMYIYTIQSGNVEVSKKMMLLK